MRFLVRIEVHIPDDIDPGELERLNAEETAFGVMLRDCGAIEHIWRLEGRRANIGIWQARDREHLDGLIDGLPMRRFVEVAEVITLLPHPVAEAG